VKDIEACVAGWTCPRGSAEAIPCEPGYQGYIDETNNHLPSCKLCPANTYSEQESQTTCIECGSCAEANGTAENPATTCVPKGDNRWYNKSTKECLCIPNYEYYDTDGEKDDSSGTGDCVQEVMSRCSDDNLRTELNRCDAKDSC
jgi:hypothetical protein